MMKKAVILCITLLGCMMILTGCGKLVEEGDSEGSGAFFWEEIGSMGSALAKDTYSSSYDSNGSSAEASQYCGTWYYTTASGNVGIAIMLEIREDGTFTKAIGSVSGSYYSATCFEGNYRLKGNCILYYDQKKSTGNAYSWEELWEVAFSAVKDIPADDSEDEIEWVDKNTILVDGDEMERLE